MGKKIEITLCDNCNGKGYIMLPDHNDPKEGVKTKCTRCNGTGRLRWTTTVEVEPYE